MFRFAESCSHAALSSVLKRLLGFKKNLITDLKTPHNESFDSMSETNFWGTFPHVHRQEDSQINDSDVI